MSPVSRQWRGAAALGDVIASALCARQRASVLTHASDCAARLADMQTQDGIDRDTGLHDKQALIAPLGLRQAGAQRRRVGFQPDEPCLSAPRRLLSAAALVPQPDA